MTSILQLFDHLDQVSNPQAQAQIDVAALLKANKLNLVTGSAGGNLEVNLLRRKIPHYKLPQFTGFPFSNKQLKKTLDKIIKSHNIQLIDIFSSKLQTLSNYLVQEHNVSVINRIYDLKTASISDHSRVYHSCFFQRQYDKITNYYKPKNINNAFILEEAIDTNYYWKEKVLVRKLIELNTRLNLYNQDLKKLILIPCFAKADYQQILKLIAHFDKHSIHDDINILFFQLENNDNEKKIRSLHKKLKISSQLLIISDAQLFREAINCADIVITENHHNYNRNDYISLIVLSMNKILLSLRFSGQKNIVEEGINGWHISADDHMNFSKTLNIALNLNPKLRLKMENKARKLISENHSCLTVAKKTYQRYLQILKVD